MYSRQHDHFEFLGCDALDLAVSRFLDTESLEDVSCLLYGSFQPSLKASHQSFSFSAPSMAALPPLTHPKSALKSTPAPGSSPPALEDDVSSQQSPVALASREIHIDASSGYDETFTQKGQGGALEKSPLPAALPLSRNEAGLSGPKQQVTPEEWQVSSGSAPSSVLVEQPKSVKLFQNPDRKSCRRLTFHMEEHPTAPSLLLDPDTALEISQRLCGVDIAPENTPSLDGDWDESQMQFPTRQREFSNTKFEAILLDELRLANDETDKLAYDIFAAPGETSNLVSLPSEVSDAVLNGSNQERFNMPKLLKWFHRVEDSYKQGVRLVKVAMSASKVLRTVKIDQESFSVSLANGTFRSTHLCYMDTAKLGYTSGEFMRLLEITEQGLEVPMVQVCGVARMPSRSVSFIFPSEAARNEFVLLLRVKIRFAKYIHGDGSSAVLRANTKGTALKHTNTLTAKKLDTFDSLDSDDR